MPDDLIVLPVRTLAQVEEAAIRSAFARLNGNRVRIMRELRISKSALLRKLAKLGLRTPRKERPRHLQEADITRAFERHRREIAAELRIHDSTLIRWINKSAPFAVEE
jgi:transcriptional regulator with PAS, ATPase and Fis domain